MTREERFALMQEILDCQEEIKDCLDCNDCPELATCELQKRWETGVF